MVSTGCVSICLMMHDKFYSQHMCNIDQWIYTLCIYFRVRMNITENLHVMFPDASGPVGTFLSRGGGGGHD